MHNTIRNTVLVVIALALVSLASRNFSGAVTTTSTAPARHYYLTKKAFNGNETLTACTSGYHFATFAEISDPPLLTYNKTLGRSAADDGAGPPSLAYGWVRTGYLSNSTPTESGVPTNCSAWTSGATSDDGEVAIFDPSAGGPNVAPVVGFINDAKCDNSNGDNIGVWCVEN